MWRKAHRLGRVATGRREKIMRVRELLELVLELKKADPEDIVVIDADGESILLLNTRPGLHQSIDETDECTLTVGDAKFLQSLGVRQ